MIELVPIWSTRRAGDPASIGHRMLDDEHGRPFVLAGGSERVRSDARASTGGWGTGAGDLTTTIDREAGPSSQLRRIHAFAVRRWAASLIDADGR